MTIREDLESTIIAIEKVKKSQEYTAGSGRNRYALLKDLTEHKENMLTYVSNGFVDVTEIEATIALAQRGGKSPVVFI